jgi:hypothetical protein
VTTAAAIAMVALAIAIICGVAFMRVLARINEELHRGSVPNAPMRTATWHLLHTPTRVMLREYRRACPEGTLGRSLQVYYMVGGAAAIVFFATVLSVL